LYNCTNITGSLADLQGKITNYLRLTNCTKITGVYTPTSGYTTLGYVYLNGTGQSTTEVDDTIIAIADTVTKANGVLETNSRSSASDAAVSTLKSRGWAITCGGVLQ
jgi:hypothetical protein